MKLKERDWPEDILKAFEELEELSKDPAMREVALNREIGLSDYITRLIEAEDKGFEKGIERGIERGIEQGIEKGIEQGKKLEQISIAKKMKEQGLSVELIAQFSGLTIEEIDQL